MGKISANTGARVMSDVALAQGLIREIAGHCWRGKGDMLDRVHAVVRRHYPAWTRRRLRGFWHGEAAGVRFHEMIELAEIARQAKQERDALEHARCEHDAFVGRTQALAALLQHQDAAFHGGQIEAMGRMVNALSGSRTGGRS